MVHVEKSHPMLTLATEHKSPLAKMFSDCCWTFNNFVLKMKHGDDCAIEK